MILDQGFPPHWRIVAASATGSLHLEEAEANQDAVSYRRLDNGFVITVADGAGSRSRSAFGSRLAVDCVCDAAQQIFAGPIGSPPALPAASRRFVQKTLRLFDQRLAATTRVRPRTARADYATTLLAVVAHPPYFVYLCLGDGFLVVHRAGDGPHLVVAADPDVMDNSTDFLTSHGRLDRLRWGILADSAVTGLALCTDGLAEALLVADRAPGGGRRYRAPAELEAYFRIFTDPGSTATELTRQLTSSEFAATSEDDKSMIVAVRR